MRWKAKLVDYYMKVPLSWREGIWRAGLALTAVTSALFGFVVWQSPELLMGLPRERMSPIEVMTHHDDVKPELYELMEEYFLSLIHI